MASLVASIVLSTGALDVREGSRTMAWLCVLATVLGTLRDSGRDIQRAVAATCATPSGAAVTAAPSVILV